MNGLYWWLRRAVMRLNHRRRMFVMKAGYRIQGALVPLKVRFWYLQMRWRIRPTTFVWISTQWCRAYANGQKRRERFWWLVMKVVCWKVFRKIGEEHNNVHRV